MKAFKNLLLFFILIVLISIPKKSFTQWAVNNTTPVTNFSHDGWRVHSDINSNYFVIVYGNQTPSGTSGASETSLKIFDINNTPLSNDITVFNEGIRLAKVKISNSNEIYVLGNNFDNINSENDLVLKKFNINGNLIGNLTIINNFQSVSFDLTLGMNDDVLISFFDTNNDLLVRSFSSNLIQKTDISVASNITDYSPPPPNYLLRSQYIDFRGTTLLVGYSRGNTPNTTSQIIRYNYANNSNVPTRMSPDYSFQGGFETSYFSGGANTSHQISLRQNNDIVYVDGLQGTFLVTAPYTNRILLDSKIGKVDTDINNYILVTKTTSARAEATLYDNNNSLIHNYNEGGKITGNFTPAIENCTFLIAGDDSKQGSDFGLNKRPPYYQLFNCKCTKLKLSVNNFFNPCLNSNLQIDAGTGWTNYKWISLPSNNLVSTSQIFQPTQSGSYVIEVDMGNDCVQRDTTTVTFINCDKCDIKPKMLLQPNPSSCTMAYSFTGTFGILTTPVGYFWDFGDGSFSTEKNGVHTYMNSGTYSVKLTVFGVTRNGECCTVEIEDTVRIECNTSMCNVKAKFNYVNETRRRIQFSNLSTAIPPTQIVGYFWDFGNGVFSNLKNPLYTFQRGGTYKVCLIVFGTSLSGDCCQDTICVDIKIRHCLLDLLRKKENPKLKNLTK